jgi:hypothetical protein
VTMLGSVGFLGGAAKKGAGLELSGGIQSVLGRRSGEYRNANVKERITRAARPRRMRRSKMRLELRARMAMVGGGTGYRAEMRRIDVLHSVDEAQRVCKNQGSSWSEPNATLGKR